MADYHKWYSLAIWHKRLRPMQLADHPLCAWCAKRGVVKAADVVHHIRAHQGDWELFTDPDNLESLCKRCHDSEAQSIERIGYNKRIGLDGWPVDDRHPMNRK